MPDPIELERRIRACLGRTEATLSPASAAIVGSPIALRGVEPGRGDLRVSARAAGIDAVGVERGPRRRRVERTARGLGIAPSRAAYAEDAIDRVRSSHVLEHGGGLRTLAAVRRRIVRRDGFLSIEVSNSDCEAPGRTALLHIGAVHPLGFDSRFFPDNLPRYGFADVGVFERDQDRSGQGVERTRGPLSIVRARAV